MSVKQTGLLIVVLVLVIGGATYLSHYISGSRRPKPAHPGPTESGAEILEFPVTLAKIAPNDPDDERYYPVCELNTEGRHDFWFENRQPTAAEVTLAKKSCTCTEVRVGILPADACRDWLRIDALAALTRMTGPPGAEFLSAAALPELAEKIQWHHLSDGQPVSVPAAGTGGAPQRGLVRLTWSAHEVATKKLTATLSTRVVGDVAVRTVSLEVPVRIATPVQIWPPSLEFGDIAPGGSGRSAFYCWSATRPNFTLQVADSSGSADSCVEIGTPRRLSTAEWEEAASRIDPKEAEERRKMAAANRTAPPAARKDPYRVVPAALCAYEVRVTLHERSPDGRQQLDIGPLNRRLDLRVDGEAQASLFVPIQATVRGEVRLLGAEQDGIRLDFKSSQGMDRTVKLGSDQSGLRLTLVGVTPDTLKGVLQPTLKGPQEVGGGAQWELRLRVPPHRAAGPLPAHSGVLLQINDGPRRIRIPVSGQATGG